MKTGDPLRDQEALLSRAERELDAKEAELATEASRLTSSAQELQSRLERLRAVLEAQARHRADAAEALERLASYKLPPLSWRAEEEAALLSRSDAVNVRVRSAMKRRDALDAYARNLTQLAAFVATEEGMLERPDGERSHVPIARLRMRSKRVRMQASVGLHTATNFFTGFSLDLSEGGVFIATAEKLPPGTEVDLEFTLPSGRKIHGTGVIRWSRDIDDRRPEQMPGLGVQFKDLAGEELEAVRQFVAQRDPILFRD